MSWHLYKCWGLAQFRLGHYEATLSHITKAVELDPGDGTNLAWIPPDELAACPDERLRKGLQELADKAIEKTGGTAYVLKNRAVLHGAFGQPEKALADFAKAIELEPADANSWYLRALARLGAGKADDYRTDCAEMLQRFSQTENPDQAHWVAWTCVLAPQATADWPKVVALAETAVKGDAKSTTNLTALGAVLFRAGRYEDALVRLSEADDLMKHPSEALKSSPVYTWFFLAMAHHHLGQHQEAKKWLDKATVWTDEALRNGKPDAAFVPWNRRLTFKLLRDEADALLNSAPVTQSPEPAIEEKEEYQENANAESGNPS